MLLEFEWVMRGIYKLKRDDIIAVFEHLFYETDIFIEHKNDVLRAFEYYKHGFDFGDALHLVGYQYCQFVYSFDNKGFAKRVEKFNLTPKLKVP